MFRSNPPIPGQFRNSFCMCCARQSMAVTTDQTFTKVGSFASPCHPGLLLSGSPGHFGTACTGSITLLLRGVRPLLRLRNHNVALTAAGTAVTATIAATSAYFTAVPIFEV